MDQAERRQPARPPRQAGKSPVADVLSAPQGQLGQQGQARLAQQVLDGFLAEDAVGYPQGSEPGSLRRLRESSPPGAGKDRTGAEPGPPQVEAPQRACSHGSGQVGQLEWATQAQLPQASQLRRVKQHTRSLPGHPPAPGQAQPFEPTEGGVTGQPAGRVIAEVVSLDTQGTKPTGERRTRQKVD